MVFQLADDGDFLLFVIGISFLIRHFDFLIRYSLVGRACGPRLLVLQSGVLPHAVFLSPVGTIDNSPAIYRWVTCVPA